MQVPSVHVPEWQLRIVLSSRFESGMRLRKLIEWVSRRVRVCSVCGPLTEERLRSRTVVNCCAKHVRWALFPGSTLCLPVISSVWFITSVHKQQIPYSSTNEALFVIMTKRINFIHSDVSGVIFISPMSLTYLFLLWSCCCGKECAWKSNIPTLSAIKRSTCTSSSPCQCRGNLCQIVPQSENDCSSRGTGGASCCYGFHIMWQSFTISQRA